MAAVERAKHRADEGTERAVAAHGHRSGQPRKRFSTRVFDFAQHMIEQQRAFAKQILKAASKGQEIASTAGDGGSGSPLSSVPSTPEMPPATSSEASGGAARRKEGKLTFEVERPQSCMTSYRTR